MSMELSTNTTPARGLALATMEDAFRFAKMVSASEFAPKDFRGKPESCLLAVQHGSEVGLGPMQSLQSIAVINGRPSVWGDAALALVMGSVVCEYVRETVDGDGDAMVATCEAKRRGYPKATVVRFTVADAKKAGLWGKSGPWTQYPRRMLQLRARGFALRDAFPDVLKGLVTAEEAQDYPITSEAPTVVARAHEPARATQVAQPSVALERPEATEQDMQKARLAISRAKAVERLQDIKGTVEQRIDEGFYTSVQASELFDLIDTRIELLTPGDDAGQEFTHEAAEHEVAS
jgi:hypothetical protein